MQLAEGRDVVEAGIGPGVGDHDQTVPHQHSATIGHFRRPRRSLIDGQLVANFGGASNPNSRGKSTGVRIAQGPNWILVSRLGSRDLAQEIWPAWIRYFTARRSP